MKIVMRKVLTILVLSLAVLVLVGVPAYAGVSADRSPIDHNWPTMSAPLQIKTYTDPNSPTGPTGDNQKAPENLDYGRGVMQTFTVPIDGNGGFTLTSIVITGFGPGSATNTCSLHLFDLNTARTEDGGGSGLAAWQNTSGYTLSTEALPIRYDYFSPNLNFIYWEDNNNNPPDQFLKFTFSGYDRVPVEPNHLYTFEIWGPSATTAGFYWLRDARNNPYPGGRGYECPGARDGPDPGIGPPDLSAPRSQLSGGSRDMVLGVYGIPFDGNAYAPQPRDYQTDVTVNPTLTWKPGKWDADTQGHQVWFGTSASNVRTRNSSVNMGRLDTNSFSPGVLAVNTTYYWKVDEYNDACGVPNPPPCHPDGNCYWGTGTTSAENWRFTTGSPYAHNPQPASGSIPEFKLNNLILIWTAGIYVGGGGEPNGHRIYFGTSFNEVNDANTSTPKIYRGERTDPNYPLIKLLEDKNGDSQPDYHLNANTIYYWRVDEVNDPCVLVGPVWSFKMPEYVTVDDFSYDGQSYMNAVWKSGLKNCTLSPPDCPKQGTKDNPATLNAGAMRLTYDNSSYCPWSEVKMDYNGIGADWTGGGLIDLRSFSISMDGNMFNDIDPEYDRMYVAIQDRAGNLGIVLNPDDLAQARQWSEQSNLPSLQWNVSLDDLKYNGTPADVNLRDVNALYIGLGSRCDWGSNGPDGSHGGTGVVAIDNIRLYMPRCLAEYEGYKSTQLGDFAGPYNSAGNWLPGDCVVNYYDLDYFASDWLKTDITLNYPSAVAPLNDPCHLMVWYKFNETDANGKKVTDWSGNSRDANVGYYTFGGFPWVSPVLWDTTGGHDGSGCINLEAGQRTWVEVPTSAYYDPNTHPDANGVTFSVWTSYDMNFPPVSEYAGTWSSVFTMHSKVPGSDINSAYDSQLFETQVPTPWPPKSHEWGPQVRFVDTRGGTPVGRAGIPWVKYSDFGIRWNHYVFTYDDVNNVKAIYQNGQRIASVDGDVNVPLPIWPKPGSFRIGTRSNRITKPDWGFWYGRLDDFRVYNYALTEREIQYLATDGTGTRNLPLIEPTNLSAGFTPARINFRDLAIMGQNWLQGDLWP